MHYTMTSMKRKMYDYSLIKIKTYILNRTRYETIGYYNFAR